MFLYILDIPKYNCIKIGIATSKDRIVSHTKTYEEINLDNSYIVNAIDERTIRALERQLLGDYYEYSINNTILEGRDGYSELREASILQDVIEDINYKADKLINKNIKVTKGIKLKTNKNNNKPYNKKEDVDETPYIKQNKANLERFLEILDSIPIEIEKYQKDNNIISWLSFRCEDDDFLIELEMLKFNLPRHHCRIIGNTVSSRYIETKFYKCQFEFLYQDDMDFKEYFDKINNKFNEMIHYQDINNKSIDTFIKTLKDNTEEVIKCELLNENHIESITIASKLKNLRDIKELKLNIKRKHGGCPIVISMQILSDIDEQYIYKLDFNYPKQIVYYNLFINKFQINIKKYLEDMYNQKYMI